MPLPTAMTETRLFDAINRPTEEEKGMLVNFLYEHLGQYRDSKKSILNALEYSVKQIPSFGGFVLMKLEENKIVGAVVVNRTGMGGYIPENILVYIATHKKLRGKGIGKLLIKETLGYAKGDIALHVEKDNPAKKLYEKFGFSNPYLEMRLKR